MKQKKVKTDSKMSKSVSASGSLPGCPLDAPKKDLAYDKRVKTPGQGDQSIEQEVQYSSEEDQGKDTVQMKILAELRRVHDRLDDVEMQVAEGRKDKDNGDRNGTNSKLSKLNCDVKRKKYCKYQTESSSSSESESDIPVLSSIRSSKSIQSQIDQAVGKLKSKREGPVNVNVSHKIIWPHEYILGGASKQRVAYDQINMCQFVQGFVKGVLDEKDSNCKERMLTYLCELMEDANDFSWSSAKVSHAVLLCEMERGALDWTDTNCINRIRRAHAQRHTNSNKQTWTKKVDTRCPWFCKAYQTGICSSTKDHEVQGKLHRHICAYCLSNGRHMSHPEKECYFSKKNVN